MEGTRESGKRTERSEEKSQALLESKMIKKSEFHELSPDVDDSIQQLNVNSTKVRKSVNAASQ
jgi:hypothetical protein